MAVIAWSNFDMQNEIAKPVTVEIGRYRIELVQPLQLRPDVILIKTDDGMRAILGDGCDRFTTSENRAIDEATAGPRSVAITE